MLTLHYTLHFATPAFLGNAEQSGQWRTPPIKALLRQWWRVAYAADQIGAVNVSAMREAEGRLFGTASDNGGGSSKSLVRIRLSQWGLGKLTDWPRTAGQGVKHDEVTMLVDPQLYLGYGPLSFDRLTKQTALKTKTNAALQANLEKASLQLAFPGGKDADRLQHALWLMQQYGTLGGRSRNGWGSLVLTPADTNTPAFDAPLDSKACMPWRLALGADWPRAIGTDEQGPLVWQTAPMADWPAVMRRLAEIKIGLRTQFKFPQERPPHVQPLDRHWLSYPITNHATSAWGRESRLPNSLRFKVRETSAGQLRGVIVHLPCLPPPAFKPDRLAVESVWLRVHQYLDGQAPALQRTPA